MKDFLNKNEKELNDLIKDKGLALRTFRFSQAGGKIKNTKEAHVLKKDIARILTLKRQRVLERNLVAAK